MIDLPSPNHGPRRDGAAIDILLIHYTGMQTAEAALARLCDAEAQVSAHYTVGEDGTVWRLVPEDRRAWHAGASFWHGDRDINSRSIGVELVNPGHEWGYRPFPDAQMRALADLARDIMGRHGISPARVLGHSDVAPARKQDPGELFDWPWLAARGIGLWPNPTPADDGPAQDGELARLLAAYGYDLAAGTDPALKAFQRHFQPEGLGRPAGSETLRRLRALSRQARECVPAAGALEFPSHPTGLAARPNREKR